MASVALFTLLHCMLSRSSHLALNTCVMVMSNDKFVRGERGDHRQASLRRRHVWTDLRSAAKGKRDDLHRGSKDYDAIPRNWNLTC